MEATSIKYCLDCCWLINVSGKHYECVKKTKVSNLKKKAGQIFLRAAQISCGTYDPPRFFSLSSVCMGYAALQSLTTKLTKYVDKLEIQNV